MSRTLFRHARVLDTRAGTYLEDHDVLVDGATIAELSPTRISSADAEIVDLRGKVLMPGLCDAHVHVTAPINSFIELQRWSPTYTAIRTVGILRGMLERGFTTVRDAGGADFGLAQAINEGFMAGPRLLFCGKALSQTGGHGDMRGPGETALDQCSCCPGLGRICDDVGEVRFAVRDEVRKGATHIKLMVSGGIASPTDRITNTQFSLDEIRAAVEEAEAAGIYCMGHAYTARAINRALECGVRSIEHGNLLDESSARLFVEKGAYYVPTLVAYETMWKEGLEAGMPPNLHAKIIDVLDSGLKALEIAHRHGVQIVYGTDLIGVLHRHQSLEFTIRAQVQKPIDVIRSATCIAADLFQLTGKIGIVAPGAFADLLVVNGDPTRDLTLLQGQGAQLQAIMKEGTFFKRAL